MSEVVSDDRVLRLERRLNARPDKVFEAWADPEQLVQWFGPEGMTIPEHDIDARVGGRWMTVMHGPDGKDHRVSGIYRAIERPRRLVFTWAWENDGQRGYETEVTVEFRPDGAGTLMILTQQAFASAEDHGRHEHGWVSTFKDLARYVEK